MGWTRLKSRAAQAYPVARLGTPEEVAAIAVHLASDKAEWVTGIGYSLDGGGGVSPGR